MDISAGFNTDPSGVAQMPQPSQGLRPTISNSSGAAGGSSLASGAMSLLGGPIGGIVGGIASSILGGQQARSQQAKAEKFAWDQFDQQKLFATDMFAAENAENQRLIDSERAFNDPKAVRARYEAAGYSAQVPFGVAGSYKPSTGASGSGANAPGAPSATPNYAPLPFRIDPASFADVMLKQAQARNLDANTQRISNETPTAQQFGTYTELRNRSLSLANQLSTENIHVASATAYKSSLDAFFTSLERPLGLQKERQALSNMVQQGHNLVMDLHRAVTSQKLDQAHLGLINEQADLAALNTAIAQIKLDYADRQEMATLASEMARAGSFSASIDLLERQAQILPTAEQADAMNEIKAIRAQMESGNWSRALFRVREFLQTFSPVASGMDAAGEAAGRSAGKALIP